MATSRISLSFLVRDVPLTGWGKPEEGIEEGDLVFRSGNTGLGGSVITE